MAGTGIKGEEIGKTSGAIAAFAIAAPTAILASMPTLEINTTQPEMIAQAGNLVEISRRLAVVNVALHGTEADLFDCMVTLLRPVLLVCGKMSPSLPHDTLDQKAENSWPLRRTQITRSANQRILENTDAIFASYRSPSS